MLFIVGDPPCPFDESPESKQRFQGLARFAIDRLEYQLGGTVPSCSPDDDLEQVYVLATFTAELVAIVSIASWENDAVTSYLKPTLPLSREAIACLRERVEQCPEEFFACGPSQSDLFDRVTDARVAAFRFDIELECELLVAQVNEDALVDVVARLLLDLSKPK